MIKFKLIIIIFNRLYTSMNELDYAYTRLEEIKKERNIIDSDVDKCIEEFQEFKKYIYKESFKLEVVS